MQVVGGTPERDSDSVKRDLIEGKISAAAAREIYGLPTVAQRIGSLNSAR